jgi:hypothetical protein
VATPLTHLPGGGEHVLASRFMAEAETLDLRAQTAKSAKHDLLSVSADVWLKQRIAAPCIAAVVWVGP